ncbi:MAG: NAD(P)-dependent oxidoreductase [Candidimonas sp.]|nr:MAG: NAD(P)-dependent oxidoreductase [Candidimonas sp.]
MAPRIGFIGLGTMGGPMAARLVEKGYAVHGFDIDRTKVDALAGTGGTGCGSIREACERADVVASILPRDAHVRSALLGDGGVLDCARSGTLVIEMSTISPQCSLDVGQQMIGAGLRFMDAPVGRTPAEAKTGELLVMAGGSQSDFESARNVFDALATKVVHVGPLGSGIRMKVVNNYMSMVSMVLTAETLVMARKAGIDISVAVEILQNTAAGRGQINVNFPKKVLAGDISPDFPIAMGHKDLSLGVALGRELFVPLFLGSSALELFGTACSAGRSNQDCTAMLEHLGSLAGMSGGVANRGS